VTSRVHIAKSPQLFEYDLDGNQTLVTTKTGIWRVAYNGENRPVRWERLNSSTPNSITSNSNTPSLITMSFDHQGRRREYLEVAANGTTNRHNHFTYDNYLQIANHNLQLSAHNSQLFVWDPTEPVATRPLVFYQPNAPPQLYAHDGNKNVSELVSLDNGTISAHYEYASFGEVILSSGDLALINPFRFSSEYSDDVLGLVYYNYRHYEPVMGRWMNRDPIEEYGGCNLAVFAGNRGGDRTDYLGLSFWDWTDYIPAWGTIKSAIDNYLGHIQGESVVDYPFVSPYDCKCNEESAKAECIKAIGIQKYEYISDALRQLAHGAVVDIVVTILGYKANWRVGTFLTLNALIDAYIKTEIFSKIMAGSNSAMKNNCDCSQYVK
jgi:RHS repeat-associated protein